MGRSWRTRETNEYNILKKRMMTLQWDWSMCLKHRHHSKLSCGSHTLEMKFGGSWQKNRWSWHVRFQPKMAEGPPWKLSSPRLGTCQVYEWPTKLANSIMEKRQIWTCEAPSPPPSPPFNSWYNQKGLCDHSKRKQKKNFPPSDLL